MLKELASLPPEWSSPRESTAVPGSGGCEKIPARCGRSASNEPRHRRRSRPDSQVGDRQRCCAKTWPGQHAREVNVTVNFLKATVCLVRGCTPRAEAGLKPWAKNTPADL